MGVRAEFAGVIGAVRDAIFTAVLFFFMLFLLRLVLRKEWIAGAAFVAIITVATTLGTTAPWIDYPIAALSFAIFAVALLRFGLLAAIVTSAVGQILALGGLLDFSAWYAGMAVMPFVLVALLVVYGFRVSLGGRTLLKQELYRAPAPGRRSGRRHAPGRWRCAAGSPACAWQGPRRWRGARSGCAPRPGWWRG